MAGDPTLEAIGRVAGFFAHPSVAMLELTGALKVGETICIKGHTTDFQQVVESMQVDRQPVQEASAGQSVGVQVHEKCRKHDAVYRLVG